MDLSFFWYLVYTSWVGVLGGLGNYIKISGFNSRRALAV